MKENKQTRNLWLTIGTVVVAFLWAAIPLLQSGASTSEPSATTILRATLSGSPISSVTPQGIAEYRSTSGSNSSRTLSVNVSSVNVPSGTTLAVFLNATQIGQMTISPNRSGALYLPSNNTQTVPTVVAGDALTVKQGTNTVLSGTFAAVATPTPFPTHTPFPSPSGSPNPSPSGSPSPSPTRTPFPSPSPNPFTSLFAQLSGATINNIVPHGFAEYRNYINTNSRRLRVFVSSVNLPANTTLTVFVGDTSVGTFNLRQGGCGDFESTANTLPTITAGTVISIRNGATTILSGTFASGFPSPSPTPSGSPTPNGSPTPTPTPRPSRSFEAKLLGANVVPAVTSTARGSVRILLNQDETEIRVFANFFGLSAAQTTATINGPAQPTANADVIFDLGAVGGTSGFIPVRTFAVTAEQVAQLRAGLWYVVIGNQTNPLGEIRGQLRAHGHQGDFDGDGCADVSVFRPTDGKWYFLDSSDNQFRAQTLGSIGDRLVAGDYDGDGIVDAAVFRNENGAGVWSILRSYDNVVVHTQWGAASDVPVAADFDGDGAIDLAVFRPSTGDWFIRSSADGSFSAVRFGQAGDVPVAADFDGDGRADVNVFRPSSGIWYQIRSGSNSFYAVQWGAPEDIPSVGDFDGDGRADITVFRPSIGSWFTLRSVDNQLAARQFGQAGDVPVVGDFDFDGLADITVFRPSNGVWYQFRSERGFAATQFGMNGDIPAAVSQ